jgi:hypothetical protein
MVSSEPFKHHLSLKIQYEQEQEQEQEQQKHRKKNKDTSTDKNENSPRTTTDTSSTSTSSRLRMNATITTSNKKKKMSTPIIDITSRNDLFKLENIFRTMEDHYCDDVSLIEIPHKISSAFDLLESELEFLYEQKEQQRQEQ